jgi:hypothetical protein
MKPPCIIYRDVQDGQDTTFVEKTFGLTFKKQLGHGKVGKGRITADFFKSKTRHLG